MASSFLPTQITNVTLSSGDNTVVSASSGQQIRVAQFVATTGANADTVLMKFTQAGSAKSVPLSLAANSTVRLPFSAVMWASCDPSTAFVVNSTTTTTNVTTFYQKG